MSTSELDSYIGTSEDPFPEAEDVSVRLDPATVADVRGALGVAE